MEKHNQAPAVAVSQLFAETQQQLFHTWKKTTKLQQWQ
jgi:hypothetical protein